VDLHSNKFWLEKWQSGKVGFHLDEVNSLLRDYWPSLAAGAKVLVPLCGKTKDLIWLAEQGLKVVGIEVSDIAIRDFFSENQLSYELAWYDGVAYYQAKELDILLIEQDFFEFRETDFDACYDRASLVALPQNLRAPYTKHLKQRLADNAHLLLVTIDYSYQDKSKLACSPPFNVSDAEVSIYWPIKDGPVYKQNLFTQNPRYQAKGYRFFDETVWLITQSG
jgi:thiopurine S-methyltransferase